MPNRARDDSADEEVTPLLKYADAHLDEWVPFHTDDPRTLRRVVDWMVHSKNSPFGWSPNGRGASQQRSYTIEWSTGGGGWTRDINDRPVLHAGRRVGRLKLRTSRAEKKRQEEQTNT
jgi:hypothetical protein